MVVGGNDDGVCVCVYERIYTHTDSPFKPDKWRTYVSNITKPLFLFIYFFNTEMCQELDMNHVVFNHLCIKIDSQLHPIN